MAPRLRFSTHLALAVLLTTASGLISAQQVALAGLLGSKALLVIDGGQPRSLAPGESHEGVKLLSLQGAQATVEVAGERMLLRLGGTPVSVGGSGDAAGGNKLVLNADARGHFMTQGQINGRSASMMVDTGASMVSLSAEQARQLGLNYTQGRPQAMSTANGIIPAWRIKLDQLRVGSVTLYNMDAVVSEGAMPYVLLGNNFLSRFQMNRNNDQMVLDKRF